MSGGCCSHQLLHPWALVFLVGTAASVAIQLHFLNAGIRHFDILLVFPIHQAFLLLASALNGMLFFREFVDFKLEVSASQSTPQM